MNTTMFCVTSDKMFEVLLNLKYSVYWNERKAARLVKLIWIFAILLAIGCSVSFRFGYLLKTEFNQFIYPIMNCTYIITAVVIYGYIFHKYRQTRLVPTRKTIRDTGRSGSVWKNNKESGVWQDFRRSRFFIPVYLILSFIVFIALPSTIHGFYEVGKTQNTSVTPPTNIITAMMTNSTTKDNPRTGLRSTGSLVMTICAPVSTILDAFIYIFSIKEVRRLFNRTFRMRRNDIQSSCSSTKSRRTTIEVSTTTVQVQLTCYTITS